MITREVSLNKILCVYTTLLDEIVNHVMSLTIVACQYIWWSSHYCHPNWNLQLLTIHIETPPRSILALQLLRDQFSSRISYTLLMCQEYVSETLCKLLSWLTHLFQCSWFFYVLKLSFEAHPFFILHLPYIHVNFMW
jgi:hypothetical protein